MKLSDYIVTFLQKKGIRHFFGYQGTMIAHLVDSIERNPETENHSGYNEQGSFRSLRIRTGEGRMCLRLCYQRTGSHQPSEWCGRCILRLSAGDLSDRAAEHV